MVRLTPIVATALVASGASAWPLGRNALQQLFNGNDLTRGNHYGAPHPPWEGGNPGWYLGNHPGQHSNLPCLSGVWCFILSFFPNAIQCPKPNHYPPHPNPTTTYTTPTPTPTLPTGTSTSSTPTPTPTPPSDGYNPTFQGYNGAIQAGDYLTFGLVETIDDCKAMCNSVAGCNFINTYHDVNGKDGSPLLTCSLFSLCHGTEDADNMGGQTQPDGSVNFIADSDGYCKA